jgi:hypothetical protein
MRRRMTRIAACLPIYLSIYIHGWMDGAMHPCWVQYQPQATHCSSRVESLDLKDAEGYHRHYISIYLSARDTKDPSATNRIERFMSDNKTKQNKTKHRRTNID